MGKGMGRCWRYEIQIFSSKVESHYPFFEKLGCDFSFPDGKIVKQKAILLI